MTVRVKPVELLTMVIWSPALARPAIAPVALCAMTLGAMTPRQAPSATVNAALFNIFLFIPCSLLQMLIGM